MSLGGSIEFGGHTFTIESHADGTVLPHISLNMGGDEIIVYPEKKEFQDYIPAELAMVKVNTIFANNESNSAETLSIVCCKQGSVCSVSVA